MNKTTKTLTYIIGIIMTIAMVGSLILPMISGQIGQTGNLADASQPTPYPEPTIPPPPDISTVSFDDRYLHQSGLFTFGAPTGWGAVAGSNTADELRASLNNPDALSVVEVRVNKNLTDIADPEGLSAFFDKTWLGHSWSGYTGWDETDRKITAEGKVQIDFNLRRARAHLIARQESWVQDGEIYSVRVVMAENAPQELKFLLQGVTNTIERLPIYAESSFGWEAYFDNSDKHIVRFPSTWEVADSADGLPATIVGDDVTLAVAAFDVALASESDAIDWMENWRSGVSARSAESVELAGALGYKVSYRLTTLDGAKESGLALMVNGSDNRLHVANLRMSDLDTDLLEADPAAYPALAVLDSFHLIPELEASLN